MDNVNQHLFIQKDLPTLSQTSQGPSAFAAFAGRPIPISNVHRLVPNSNLFQDSSRDLRCPTGRLGLCSGFGAIHMLGYRQPRSSARSYKRGYAGDITDRQGPALTTLIRRWPLFYHVFRLLDKSSLTW